MYWLIALVLAPFVFGVWLSTAIIKVTSIKSDTEKRIDAFLVWGVLGFIFSAAVVAGWLVAVPACGIAFVTLKFRKYFSRNSRS